MKLTRGVKIEDDDETEYRLRNEEKADLSNADRERSNTEKQLDDILFKTKPVRKRKDPSAPSEVKKQESPSKVSQAASSSEQSKYVSKTSTTETIKVVTSKTVRSTVLITEETQQLSELGQTSNAKHSEYTSNVQFSFEKKKNNGDLAPVVNIGQRQSLGLNGKRPIFNKPGYIRKLKKVAENYNYDRINPTHHLCIDVVRPYECKRDNAVRQNTSDFVDRDFPPVSASLGQSYKKKSVVWQKASEMYSKPTFGKYVDPNDIEPGQLSCQSFLSVLSCLAERQSNIKKLIEGQSLNENGFYYVRLNINSVWRYIVVDDFLPENGDGPLGATSFRDSQSEISISLIEKAYAKAYNTYQVFTRASNPEDYLRDLTGSIVRSVPVSQNSLLEDIEAALQNGWTVVGVPSSSIEQLGLAAKNNLSIIGLKAGKVELRNSWGTLVERPKISISREGVFELTISQVKEYLSKIVIAETFADQYTTTIQSKHLNNFYSCYRMKIKKQSAGYISVSQWDHRLFPEHAGYAYSPFRVIIERKAPKQKGVYVDSGFSFSEKNVSIPVSLSAGEYNIYCVGWWKKGCYDYDLTFHGNDLATFTKLQTVNSPNMISQCLETVNLQNGKRSSKGHVDEHIMYHEFSNLVLITLTNISDKDYTYSYDLSKINFGTLELLNGNQNDSYSNLLKSELTQIKKNQNTNRVWTVELKPQEHYTWVISTSENYDALNFKKWGFK